MVVTYIYKNINVTVHITLGVLYCLMHSTVETKKYIYIFKVKRNFLLLTSKRAEFFSGLNPLSLTLSLHANTVAHQ